MRSIEWWYFQWPWGPRNRFSRPRHFWSRMCQKRCVLGTILLKNTNRKLYTIYQMVPISMTLSDFWPGFQGHDILKSNIWKTSVLKTQLLFHANGKLHLTYGIVLYLVTSTDLYTRRAGLSASAELLVFVRVLRTFAQWGR